MLRSFSSENNSSKVLQSVLLLYCSSQTIHCQYLHLEGMAIFLPLKLRVMLIHLQEQNLVCQLMLL